MTKEARAPIMVELADESATEALAANLAAVARRGDVFALMGALGSGKTVFARAFINARAVRPEDVLSPTFTLVQAYEFDGNGEVPVYHFDLFRIKDTNETRELGMEDAFADGISLIEWPEKLNGRLPDDVLEITLDQGPTPDSRRARLVGFGSWRRRLAAVAGK
jgi:tRNA threonylcarbamoyladenosine biosynthesis protein TsaE